MEPQYSKKVVSAAVPLEVAEALEAAAVEEERTVSYIIRRILTQAMAQPAEEVLS